MTEQIILACSSLYGVSCDFFFFISGFINMSSLFFFFFLEESD